MPRARLQRTIDATPWLDWLLLSKRPENFVRLMGWHGEWPRNVWAGTTVEDQRRADERIPLLLRVPAAVRFLSVEPLLEEVDLHFGDDMEPGEDSGVGCVPCGAGGKRHQHWIGEQCGRGIHWVIVGGESGAGARPFDLSWARSIVAQCKAARVPVFVKQLGARPVVQHPMDAAALLAVKLASRKGGDMAEWSEDLCVRQFPSTETR